MKNKFLILSFIIFLTSCSTYLDYDKKNNDISKYQLIEKILKTPEVLFEICEEDSIIDEFYIKNFCTKGSIKRSISWLTRNFRGRNLI